LPGVQGRLDHFTIDAKRRRVIFSGLGNDTVQVVDVFAGRMIHQIDRLAQPQDTLYLAEWDTDMGKFAAALGARTGVWYEKRDRLYVGAPPSGIPGARLLVFEAQTD
jgi:hypothetical protein